MKSKIILLLIVVTSIAGCKKGVPILSGGVIPDPMDGMTGKPATISSGAGTATSGAAVCGAIGKACKVTARVGLQQWSSDNPATGSSGSTTYKLKGSLTVK